MTSRFARFICRILAASLIVLPWQAQAEMIATDQALNAAQATVARFVEREQVASQLQLLGITPQAAKERVAALTDAQVAEIAGRIDELPAGSGALQVLVVLWLIFYFCFFSPGALFKDQPAKPAPAPAKK